MDKQMSDDLKFIKDKVIQHDELMVKMVEISEKQIASNDKLNDHIIRTDKRMDKQDVKIDSNYKTILQWSGGATAVIAVIGIYLKLSSGITG